MNSRSLRRLAADHSTLHNEGLPPNYFFSPYTSSNDDLTQFDVLLAGPMHTPFSAGVFKLHLDIPPTYPQQPPTAFFRTPLFHPNVEPRTGGVCVETLKRDWDSKLTLKDVLVTISCLLIQPNPDSALNADAGHLIQQNYESFANMAKMMTGIHAVVPKDLVEHVKEAQMRGQEENVQVEEESRPRQQSRMESSQQVPARRRRTIARVRSTMAATKRSDGSPTGPPARRTQPRPQSVSEEQDRPFVFQSGRDDVFGGITTPPPRPTETLGPVSGDDSNIDDPEQENDATRSPAKPPTSPVPHARTPRRPQGAAVPLGELSLDTEPEEEGDTSEDVDMEPEYPPSPRKSSPRKNGAAARRQQMGRTNGSPGASDGGQESSNQHALFRAPPPRMNPPGRPASGWQSEGDTEIDEDDSAMMDVTFEEPNSASRVLRRGGGGSGEGGVGLGLFNTPPKRRAGKAALNLEVGPPPSFQRRPSTPSPPTTPTAETPFAFATAGTGNRKAKLKANAPVSAKALAKVVKLMNSAEKKAVELQRRKELDERLWIACGRDVGRWNRGDFSGDLTVVRRGARW
ncbi:unnamed protein product [Zymoseptoria tritici ST99CH_1A5]|uniref:Ubiquitin-conjugating enzyme E2 2 n=1 Tax=Zymoseptoria tritici ST99CH_1A5 TaxID=1276529 RepID=A0A1Y6L6T0_ZYMTR|nr:unnamed protein product [Zymoseptoria tritici ST99CH_1A5]